MFNSQFCDSVCLRCVLLVSQFKNKDVYEITLNLSSPARLWFHRVQPAWQICQALLPPQCHLPHGCGATSPQWVTGCVARSGHHTQKMLALL